MLRQIECVISGRVQMVLYRDFTRRKACSLGLVGFVHNNPDGTVTVLAQGDEGSLTQLLADLHRGSFLSRVDAVETKWSNAEQSFSDFSIR